MFNAVSFKHNINVCACAVSALILLPVVNLSMDSATLISWRGHFRGPTLLLVYFGDFSQRMRSFNHTTTSV